MKTSSRVYAYLVDVIVEPDNGQFYAHCLGLEGIHEAGSTPNEALAHAYDAFLSILEVCLQRGDPIPEGPHLIALRTPPDLLELKQKIRKIDRKGHAHLHTLLIPVPHALA